jgi:hypothetical protein
MSAIRASRRIHAGHEPGDVLGGVNILQNATPYYLMRFVELSRQRGGAAPTPAQRDAAQRKIRANLALYHARIEMLWHLAHRGDAEPPEGWDPKYADAGETLHQALVTRLEVERRMDRARATAVAQWCMRCIGEAPPPSRAAAAAASIDPGRHEYLFLESLESWLVRECRLRDPEVRRPRTFDAPLEDVHESGALAPDAAMHEWLETHIAPLVELVEPLLRDAARLPGRQRAAFVRHLQCEEIASETVRAAWARRAPAGLFEEYPCIPRSALDTERLCFPALGRPDAHRRRAAAMRSLRSDVQGGALDAAAECAAILSGRTIAPAAERRLCDLLQAVRALAPLTVTLLCRELQRGGDEVARCLLRLDPDLFARHPVRAQTRGDVARYCYPGERSTAGTSGKVRANLREAKVALIHGSSPNGIAGNAAYGALIGIRLLP